MLGLRRAFVLHRRLHPDLERLGDRKVLRAELAGLWSVVLDNFEADLRRAAG